MEVKEKNVEKEADKTVWIAHYHVFESYKGKKKKKNKEQIQSCTCYLEQRKEIWKKISSDLLQLKCKYSLMFYFCLN